MTCTTVAGEVLTAVKQEVVVELPQRVAHLFRHGALVVLCTVLEAGQQKNLKRREMRAVLQSDR